MKIILLLLFIISGFPLFAQDELSLVQERTFTGSVGGMLTVETDAGGIDIKTVAGSGVRVKIFANERAKNNMTFNMSDNSSGVIVTGKMKEKNINGNINISYEITLPEGYDVQINTGGGGIEISGVKGKTDIKTAGGGIELSNMQGDINASTMGGGVRINSCRGNVNISSMGGNIKTIDFKGALNATTMGGGIELSGSDGPVKAITYGGNISLSYTGENEGIELTTMGGNIVVEIPESFNANANLSTSTGDISIFSQTSSSWENNVSTSINAGGKELKCSTMAGHIKIKSR